MTKLVFGSPDDIARNKAKSKPVNPMISIHGRYVFFAKCRDCVELELQRHHSKNYYKCRKRGMSRGQGTDHRLSWDACRLFRNKWEL